MLVLTNVKNIPIWNIVKNVPLLVVNVLLNALEWLKWKR